MADPLSITASILALLEATVVTIGYLKDIHDAPQDRIDFLVEISSLEGLLRALDRRVQDAGSGSGGWLSEVKALGVENGPLDQLRSDLDGLRSKLRERNKFKEITRRLTWKFTKPEINAIISKVERIKLLATFALANDVLTLSRMIKEDSSEIKTTVNKIDMKVGNMEMSEMNKEYREFTAWLSPLDFETTQNEVFQRRENGTGGWLLKSKEFMEWRDGTSGSIWCPGMPGAGKTFLTSIVVNHLQRIFEDQDVAVACIYCNYQEHTDQTISNLISSLLKQILQSSRVTSKNIESLYQHHKNRTTRPALGELLATLKAEIGTHSKVFFVVDALDECNEKDGTRDTLLQELMSLSGSVNLMFTSRDLPSIAREFQGTIRLEMRANNQDVRSYIEGRIYRSPRQHLKVKSLQKMITDKVVANSKGIFLLARLHMDSLVAKHSLAAVRKALEMLPKEVDDKYDEIMARIERQSEDDEDLAKEVLMWITYATRPLSVKELQYALAIIPTTSSMDPDGIIDEDILTSVCAGLVVIDDKRRIFHLVHYTTQQYFERNRRHLFPNAQAIIASKCLTYLSYDGFARGYCHNDQEFRELLRNNHFLSYAAREWGTHAYEQLDNGCTGLAQKFLEDNSKVACASQVLLVASEYRYFGYSQRFPKGFSGVHMSSFFGLRHIVGLQLLEAGTWADSTDDNGRTPLSWTAELGNEAVVQLLVARPNVEPDSKDNNQRTPLSWAAENGHEGVVRLLLSKDSVDPDSMTHNGRTPLSWAAENGHEGVVRLLLSRNSVNLNSRDNNGRTPLYFAAGGGHEGVVELLLARGDVDADSKDADGWTPLSSAAANGRERVVRLLVAQANVDTGSKDKYGWTPLCKAARHGHVPVVRLLLAKNIDPDPKNNIGRTPLSFAAGGGHEEVVRLLITRVDVDLDSKDKNGWTPLSKAARNGREGVVRMLLAQGGIDVNSKDDAQRTPLSWAAFRGHYEVVRLLASWQDVDVDSKDRDGRTPLSCAAELGREAVVQLLVTRNDVDADSKDNKGQTPLSWAARNGHRKVVRILASRDDVEVDFKDDGGLTPLAWANAMGQTKIVALLSLSEKFSP